MGLTHLVLLSCFLFLSSVVPFGDDQESFDAIPDCDSDFAMHALPLIQSKLGDTHRQREIEAILASCNKPMIQKITEASIHLLEKGVIPTPLIQQLQELSAAKKKERRLKFAKIGSEAPPEFKPMIYYVGNINTNDSLSGNEKLLYIQAKLLELNPIQRLDLRRILAQQERTTASPVVPAQGPLPTFVIPPHPLQPTVASPPSIPITKQETERQKPEFNPSMPPSFSIGRETDNLLFSSKKIAIDSERNLLPTRDKKEEPSVFIRTLSTGVKELPNRPEPVKIPPSYGLPISAQVLSQGKPRDTKNVEDLDLLNSRNNIWAEAAKFLDQSTNIPSEIRNFLEKHGLTDAVFKGNPHILAALNMPANAFPLPTGATDQLNKAYSGSFEGNSQARKYLPVRQRDAIIPEIRFKGLERFDTQMGRFAVGDPNSKQIFAQIPREQALPSQQNVPLATTVLPATVTTWVPLLEGGVVQVPNRASGFVQFPTYPPPPPSPIKITSTPVPKVAGSRGEIDRFPSFPSVDTTVGPIDPKQEFVPYRGPEDITGSRRYPPVPFNQQVSGRQRFVKIDLLNEH